MNHIWLSLLLGELLRLIVVFSLVILMFVSLLSNVGVL